MSRGEPEAVGKSSGREQKSITLSSKISIIRRIRALSKVTERLECSVPCILGTALRSWCRLDYSCLPNPRLPYSRDVAAEPEVIAFVAALRQLDFLEATYWLSSAYAMLADAEYRKRLAMYFTPVSLTRGLLDDLAEQGVDFGSQSFLDPACGGAAFLAPIALRMRTKLLAQGKTPRQLLKHIEKHLYGTDLDKTLCELSRHFLCMALCDDIRKSDYLPKFQVRQADSLSSLKSKYGKVDVVVCNPPYRRMTAKELEPLQSSYGTVVGAQANLYGLFIALCVRLLRIDGYAALVTPTSFLSGQHFGQLRAFLMRYTDIAHIGMVSDRQGIFIDVEQETALTVLRRRTEVKRTHTRANISVVSRAGKYKSVGECLLPNAGTVWPIPRSVEDVGLLKAAAHSKFRLSDYGYKVRVGAYVWNRDARPTYESIKQAKRAKASKAVPLLWSRDISYPSIVRLDPAEVLDGAPRFIDLGQKTHASIVTSPSVVMQRVTSNDQSRRLVVAAVSRAIFSEYGGFVGENHVVIVERVTSNPALPPTKLARLLSTHAIDRYFRCISGATNVSAFELNQLILPDPKILKAALANGSNMDEAVVASFETALK